MRKITPLLIALSILGCKKPKPLNVYKLTIDKQELNSFSGRFENESKTDTIMAVDDTIAYEKGLIRYYSSLKAEEFMKKKGIVSASHPQSFTITDSAGFNIKYKLSVKLVDSLTLNMEKVSSQIN